MEFSNEMVTAFGVALNEASLVSVEVAAEQRWASVTFAVLALPADDGPSPPDPRVQLILQPVGRIAASLRHGNWNDADAPVEQFELDRLSEIAASFNQQFVYGWNFLDVPDGDGFTKWADRLALTGTRSQGASPTRSTCSRSGDQAVI